MADIELVIRISEEKYKDIQGRDWKNGKKWFSEEWQAIHNGTPLPKGHGRLIDADRTALLSDLFCYTKFTGIDEAPYEDATKALAFAPTIIEADTESNDEWDRATMIDVNGNTHIVTFKKEIEG